MDEVAKLKAIIVKLEKNLKETQESLDKLQKNIIKSCDDAIAILRDNEHYHKLDDYTECYEENGLPKDFTDKFKIEDEGGL